MHELSVAMEICRIAEAQVGTAGATRIRRVAVCVGDDAGLEPSSLAFCLETLLAEPPFAGATVDLVPAPGNELRVDYLEVDDDGASD
jgi:Zn finger protein HypA/HybF involved in hydrogenase expression